jgi:hypothetical protein
MGRWHDYAWCWADPHQNISNLTPKWPLNFRIHLISPFISTNWVPKAQSLFQNGLYLQISSILPLINPNFEFFAILIN